MNISRKQLIITLIMAVILGTGIILTACKSKKKSTSDSNEDQNINTIAAPQYAELKTPLVAASFTNNPTFTVRQVEEGDTVRLYKKENFRF